LKVLYPLISRQGVPFPEIKVRKMKRRWGSCQTNGCITLNLRLIQASIPYIDYVMIHELCHLVEPNHSRRFYALLDALLPDWRGRRERLNRLAIVEV
jgi:predicted metal-dependent hydrolase